MYICVIRPHLFSFFHVWCLYNTCFFFFLPCAGNASEITTPKREMIYDDLRVERSPAPSTEVQRSGGAQNWGDTVPVAPKRWLQLGSSMV